MVPGSYYPDLDAAAGGYKLPFSASSQGTHAEAKKYVVGTPADNGGKSNNQASGNNTYIMRFADVLLIEAEAILGQQAGVQAGTGIPMTASTSDAAALQYVNMVRARVNIPPLTSLTYKQLINKRRLEFALEHDYWFDLCRLDGFNVSNHPTAIAIISAQNRGDSSAGTAPYYNVYTRYNDNQLTPTNAQFLYPVPVTESTSDPNLLLAPVPYVFK